MKKVMIYTKKTNINANIFFEKIKENSTVILLFSFFILGLIVGSKTYIYFNNTLEQQISFCFQINGDLKLYIKTVVILIIIGIILSIFSASSCFGLPIIWMMLFAFGYLNAVSLMQLINLEKIKGLEYYALILLPGTLLRLMSLMLLGEISGIYSKKTAVNMLFKGREEVNPKKYLLYILIGSGISVLSVLVNMVSYKVFCGLF